MKYLFKLVSLRQTLSLDSITVSGRLLCLLHSHQPLSKSTSHAKLMNGRLHRYANDGSFIPSPNVTTAEPNRRLSMRTICQITLWHFLVLHDLRLRNSPSPELPPKRRCTAQKSFMRITYLLFRLFMWTFEHRFCEVVRCATLWLRRHVEHCVNISAFAMRTNHVYWRMINPDSIGAHMWPALYPAAL